jgi:hypothetical protein
MHEAAIIQSLLEQAGSFVPDGAVLKKVKIDVGRLEHLDETVMQATWSALTEGTALAGVRAAGSRPGGLSRVRRGSTRGPGRWGGAAAQSRRRRAGRGEGEPMKVQVVERVLKLNDEIAQLNRGALTEADVKA